MRRIKALIMALIILIVSVNVSVFAIDSETCEIDEFLLSVGMQNAVVDSMSVSQKLEIFLALQDENICEISFESFSVRTYNVPECEYEEEYLTSEMSVYAGDMFIPFSSIPSSDLQLTVSVFRMTVSGVETFAVFPSFRWRRAASIRNDGFAIALFPGWEVNPSHNPTLRIVTYWDWSHQYAGSFMLGGPTSASHSGYGWARFNTASTPNLIFEGNVSMQARRTTPSATRAVTMHYVHDTSSFFDVSFSFSLGPASIGIAGNGNALRHMAGNFSFSY
ncbi:MAG: hypothetical protein FWE11_10335 [Defluviitaleaceae bacterium]|nr:hypothetical protein [Defluviitaleaceae bacterium]